MIAVHKLQRLVCTLLTLLRERVAAVLTEDASIVELLSLVDVWQLVHHLQATHLLQGSKVDMAQSPV
jgi:hypothetical protein